jgi:hypothetical protein
MAELTACRSLWHRNGYRADFEDGQWTATAGPGSVVQTAVLRGLAAERRLQEPQRAGVKAGGPGLVQSDVVVGFL